VKSWELFLTVATRDGMSGAWQIDWHCFQVAVGAAVLEDDDERMQLMRAMKVCLGVLNNPKTALFSTTDAPEDE